MDRLMRIAVFITVVTVSPVLWASCGGSGEGEDPVPGTYYADTDGDGYGDVSSSQVLDSAQAGWVLDSTDCNDTPVTGASIHPGAAEICDNIDNDCDPLTDDGADASWMGSTCDGGDSDLCEEGTYSCTGGLQVCSDTTGDLLDVCDGADNDCNPATADGYDELTYGDACDGTDSDECQEGTMLCTGVSMACSDTTGDNVETCNNLDDDCDGTVDNEWTDGTVTYTDLDGTAGLSKNDSCGIGDCSGGTVVCASNETDLTCSTAGSAAQESCDGADNDCDGVVDNGSVCGVDSGGVPVSGYPVWQERTLLVLTNAVRMDPTGWRDKYYPYSTTLPSGSGILMPGTYPSVSALYYTSSFNQSARYHSEDMADNCDLQHNSCDGTLWSTRLGSYYGAGYSSLGENAAYNIDPGVGSPLDTLNQLLCDKDGLVCSVDDSPTDGHRANIMSSQFVESGMGYAYSYRFVSIDFYDTHWWTMDFGSRTDQPVFKPVLVAGSHEMTGSTLTYFANYYSPADTSQGVDLVLDGTPVTMSLDMGTLDAGTWTVTAATATSCQSYYFEATDSGGQVWRYPGEGEFRTFGIGNCTEDYEGE